jgi:exodeoxyribonuclease VII large subunit
MDGMHLRVKGFIDMKKLSLSQVLMRSKSGITQYIRIKQDQLVHYEQVSVLKDPVNILKMGYSISLKNGKPLKSVAQVQSGDQITTKLSDGQIHSITV